MPIKCLPVSNVYLWRHLLRFAQSYLPANSTSARFAPNMGVGVTKSDGNNIKSIVGAL